jgi:hypothetical protein
VDIRLQGLQGCRAVSSRFRETGTARGRFAICGRPDFYVALAQTVLGTTCMSAHSCPHKSLFGRCMAGGRERGVAA